MSQGLKRYRGIRSLADRWVSLVTHQRIYATSRQALLATVDRRVQPVVELVVVECQVGYSQRMQLQDVAECGPRSRQHLHLRT